MSDYPAPETRLFINGEFCEATGSKKRFPSINPATLEMTCEFCEASESDVDKAVKAAYSAFQSWQYVDGRNRGNLLYRLAEIVEENKEKLAYMESIDTGKPISVARDVDMKITVDTLRYFAGWADKLQGKTIPIQSTLTQGGSDQFFCFTKLEPVGVVAQIIAWNFPLLLLAMKIGPALACGCAVVIKPSEKTSITALMLAQYINEAGFPKGVFNVVLGFGPSVGNCLIRHPLINKVAFTGSCTTGAAIAAVAAQSGPKKCSLELGGKSPLIVFADADIDKSVEVAHLGLFFNMGQCCVASSRVFVHESIYDEFVQKSIKRIEMAKLGRPQDDCCTHGPQIDEIQFNKIMDYIQIGKQEGATCLIGGRDARAEHGNGYWLEPTLFVDVEDFMKIANEEIFGPVMCILKFKTREEVIRRANETPFGLGAGVCTREMSNAFAVINKLKVGTVYVNCYTVLDTAAPFGGFKQSGYGREFGEYGLNEYVEVKTVIMNIGQSSS